MSWRRFAYLVAVVELVAGVAMSVQVAQALADPVTSLSGAISHLLAGFDLAQFLSPLPQTVLRLVGL